MSEIVKFFTKTAVSAARSLLLSEVKGSVKSLINSKKAKTIQDINQEMIRDLGYVTTHFSVDKNKQDILYKSSPIFCHEWLTSSPFTKENILRDEESGQIYFNGEQLSNAKKLEIINRFIGSTKIKTASVASHMEQAFKLIDATDYTSVKFKEHFSGWNEANESVIDKWISNVFGHVLETDLVYANMLFRKWIIGTAKRAITPGVNFDGCLVFSGPGGVGKTAFFRNLLPEPFNNRTGEILCSVKNPQKFVESIKYKTIACFDELSVLDYPASEEIFKQLLTSQHIDVRLAWARDVRRYNLRCGFAATTNKNKFIFDEFLSRRLWAIKLNNKGRLNFNYLFANRENLWKEAVYLANKNEPYNLSFEEQKLVEDNNLLFSIRNAD